MDFEIVKTVVSFLVGSTLIVFSGRFAELQKAHASLKDDVVSNRLRNISAAQLKYIAMFFGCLAILVSLISLIELL